MKANAHDCVSALTNLFTNDVVIEHGLVTEDHTILRIRFSLLSWLLS
jgi:hypothetical protein